MTRKPRIDENGIKRGAWSQEEDEKLKSYVQKYGHWNWRQLPKFAELSRCGKSCRLRWLNYLRKDVKKGNYTEEEADLILKLWKEHGNKWSLISSRLPGRTDNDIKNYWHSCLKKRAKQIPAPCSYEFKTDDISECNKRSETIQSESSSENYSQSSESCSEVGSDLNDEHSNLINLYSDDGGNLLDFWTKPFLLDVLDDTPNFSWSGTDEFVSPYLHYDIEDNTDYFAQIYNQDELKVVDLDYFFT